MNHNKATTIRGDFYEKNAKRLYAEHLDNPKELKKLFLVLVKNNNVLRNNIQFYEELVEMHEKDESPEIESIRDKYETLKYEHQLLEQEKEEKWIEHIEPVEDSIRKAYQDEIDKLKKEVSRLNMLNNNQASLIKTLRNKKKK